MCGNFPNFEQPQLLHLLVYQPKTCRDLLEWNYLICVKNLWKKIVNLNFGDVIATQNISAFLISKQRGVQITYTQILMGRILDL